MRKIVLSMHVTLDGFAAGPNGEMDWIKIDEEIFDFVKSLTDNADAALYGRVTWEMMESYWPTAGKKPNATKHDKIHSEWYNNIDKIVLSNSLKGKSMHKTFFLSNDIPGEIENLKQGEGNDILIFGSPSTVRLLMEHNLIDEYWFLVNPVILGQGLSMFAKLDERINLTFKSSKTFSCGVTALNYSVIKK
jgi:dihydrofolate reductase